MKLDFLKGSMGEQSSKRVNMLVIMILFVIYFIANLFWAKDLTDGLRDLFQTVFILSYTGVMAEKLVNSTAKKIEQPKVPNVPDTTNIEQVKIENKQ